jgi:uncharacterized SAM-binding protein YcdF (DUF218 family)
MSHVLPNREGNAGIAGTRVREDSRSPARKTMRLMRTAVVVAGLCGIGLVVGFVAFAINVSATTPPADPRAQGIVVLTGGSARIEGALRLLAEGRAERLLISGVNEAVSLGTLAGTVDRDLELALACCVDLGRDARDTIGNAAETRDWAATKGFTSLIVVTSDYHMPRSMAELAEAMPKVKLIPYPVTNPDLHLGDWWNNAAAFALLVREYGKYLLATARVHIAGAAPTASRGA